MYKNYIFDLYGTLVDINTDEYQDELWKRICLFFGYNGANYEPEEFKETYYNLICTEEEKILGKGAMKKSRDSHEAYPEIQLEYIFQKMYEKKGVKADFQMCIYSGQCFRAMSTDYIRLYDGTIDLLEKIRIKGGKVYLLSNAQRVFTEYEIKMLGIEKYFDDIFISSDYYCRKPDKRFISKLIDKHNIDINKSIMIGNDLSTDVAVAKSVGMDTFFIYSNLSPKMDYVADKIDSTFKIGKMDLRKVASMIL